MKRAFTLLELLVVIATIAVILAVALPALHGARERARAGRCLSNLRSIATGAAQYVEEFRHLPQLLDPTDDFAVEYGVLRCPVARLPDEGGYVMPIGVGGMAGGFSATTWIGRVQVQDPSKVAVVYCWRHTPGMHGYMDGHAR